ncbi:PAS domain S-box protein [Phaeocystidibacter luteus]|uniref:histidine kinase n=1 Tax=Phaeocystidibacter luteus TaxID=911197 RepID=A0A6N6RMK9_9FLAO|nr:PAS domain S-box protein [Phaeocystidibacter luteus]KAB2814811.1 PAS domain S-box protein [Phaeocystidibacter luteus]
MRPAGKTALITFAFGIIWIWGSDFLLYIQSDEPHFHYDAAFKGTLFVMIIAVIIYLLVRNYQYKLLTSEKSYRKLFNDSPEPIIIIRLQDGVILDLNPAAVTFYEYPKNELVGGSIDAVRISEKDLSAGTDRHVAQSGRKYTVDLKINELVYQGEDALIISIHDVTEREELKNALQQRERLYNALVKSDRAYLIRVNMDGIYEFVNESYQNAFKHINKNFVGMSYTETVHPDDIQKCIEVGQQCMASPSRMVPASLRKHDGKGGFVRTTWEYIAILDEDGKVKGLQGLGRDEAELDAVKSAFQKNETRINVILNSIKDGFFILDKELNVELVNNAFAELLKASPDELIGKPISEVIPNWQSTVSSIEIPKALADNQLRQYEAYNPFFDMWLEISAVPFDDGMAVLYRDVSKNKESKLAIEKNEANLQSLINNTRDFIWSIDTNYIILTSNKSIRDAGEKIGGGDLSPGNTVLTEQGDENLYHLFKSSYDRMLRGEHVQGTYDVSILGLGVDLVTFNGSPIRDSDNNIIGAACFAQDVTEQEAQKIALDKEIERYNIIAAVTKDAIWDYVVNSDKLTWSTGLKSSYGYDLTETDLDWWGERVHPADQQKAVETFDKALSSSSNSWSSQYRFRKSNGEYVWVNDRGLFIRDEEDNAVRAVGSIQDIDELVKSRKENETLSLAVSRSSVGLIITDPEGKIEWVNKAFEELTGYELPELVGHKPGQILQGENSSPKAIEAMSNAVKNGEDVTTEILNYRKDKSTYWVRMSISPIRENGEITRFMALATDITMERAINARLIQQNENLKKIAFILSHELRKPVSSILGLLELFDAKDTANPMNADIIKYMHKATSELDEMVHEIIRQSALVEE